MTNSNFATTAPRPQNDDIQAALDLLHAREAALASLWADAAKRYDADQLLEIGGRQAEVAGMIRAIRGLMA
jgi:hypothetical protein